MAKKTYLEKLESGKNYKKTYHCKENDAVIVFEKEGGEEHGQALFLSSATSTSASVIGVKDLKSALKTKI